MAFRLVTSPKDAPSTIEHMLHEVFEVPHDAKILDRAKQARDESQRNDWILSDDIVNRLMVWRMLGESGDPRISFDQKWTQVGMPELDAVTADLRHAPRTVVIWGNLAGLDRAALAKYGKLEELTPAQLLDAHHLFGSGAKKPARGGRMIAKHKKK
jgi:hypothetical protein